MLIVFLNMESKYSNVIRQFASLLQNINLNLFIYFAKTQYYFIRKVKKEGGKLFLYIFKVEIIINTYTK